MSGTSGRPTGSATLRRPLTPMLAATVDVLPTGPGLAYEPKWDGWRAIAFRDADDVRLQSRAGRDLTRYFPDVIRSLHAAVPPDVVLDGELVVWAGGRTDFAQLQSRVTAGSRLPELVRRHPAHYVVFDLLVDAAGHSLLDRTLAERRALLTDLLRDAPAELVLCPQTTDATQAAEWMATWTRAGVEGVVVKRLGSRYEPGRRGWRKVRSRASTETIVGGVTGTVDDPDTLLTGRFDQEGRLRYMGRTHPLHGRQRRELAKLLQPAPPGSPTPWPRPLPPTWAGQLDGAEPLEYTPVEPTLVVEIEVDTAYEHHRWRHRVRYLRVRTEVPPMDLPRISAEGSSGPPEPLGPGG
ncbi:MAG: ATP-dependent DNA ligase [Micromonospora sp.]